MHIKALFLLDVLIHLNCPILVWISFSLVQSLFFHISVAYFTPKLIMISNHSVLRAKDLNLKNKEKPKSMVTYDKGPPRWPQDKEKSELNKENLHVNHE